jgi:CHAT domain-containing protein/lipoprotein NlpI
MNIAQNGRCLNDQEFYEYIAGKESDLRVQAHLSNCSTCRQDLAELLRTLDESLSEPVENPQPLEIEQGLKIVQGAARTESRKILYKWGSVAAAALVAIGLCSVGFVYIYIRAKSQSYCNQARVLLQQVYQARSPNDLRLDLPFKSEVSQRAANDSEEVSSSAERLFNQAIGVRDGMSEALLGLGYLDLQKNRFNKAERDFQKVLDSQPANLQALLGRGVSRFEKGLASVDPIARKNSLDQALTDFEKGLKLNPDSSEARYNKIQILYNTGRHKEALQDIQTYLSRDPDSIWAAKLKELRIRIQMNSSEMLKKSVNQAALARDAQFLDTLARVVPGKITAAVISLFRNALADEGSPAVKGSPDSSSMQWAAKYLARSYQNATGDDSCSRLINFYAGLSPPQRQNKKKLDTRLEQLIELYDKKDFQSSLARSESLTPELKALGDYWQLVRAYQLRGTCWFYGKSDFVSANREYQEMLRYAELTGDADLIARSLGAVAASYLQMFSFDNAMIYISKLEKAARDKDMDYWRAYSFALLGRTYFGLNQYEKSLQQFESSLSLAYRILDPLTLPVSLVNIGIVMERIGRLEAARSCYAESERWLKQLFDEQPNPQYELSMANIHNMLGNLALRKSEFSSAEAEFQKGLSGQPDHMREVKARNHIGLAQTYMNEKNFKKAAEEIEKALKLSQSNSYPENTWQARDIEGKLLKQRGDIEGALASFRHATDVIEGIRTTISSSELRQSFFEQRFNPYREIVSLLYHNKKNVDMAISYSDRAKSMTLREFLNRQSNTESSLKILQASRSITKYPPSFRILEYFIGNNEVFAFLSDSNGTNAVSIHISEIDLEKSVRDYLKSIEDKDTASFNHLSRKLYETLIDPAFPMIKSGSAEILVILADGPLHMLPFSSLIDHEGHYLIEKIAIANAPSRGVLHYCLNNHNTGKISAKSSILLLDGGSGLKGANRELTALVNLFNHTRLLSYPDISVGPSLENYEIVHFSGHAKLHLGKPQMVFRTSAGDRYVDSPAIQKWNLKGSKLIVLAGCNTGVGPIFDGETPWGLVPAFMGAGAPSLLVSLLPVDDLATASLTSRFYELLSSGSFSKAQALRSAQISLIKSEAGSNPASWAPFVLIGDPR